MKVRKLMSAGEARSIVIFNEKLLEKTISAIDDALALGKFNAFICDCDDEPDMNATCDNLEIAVSIFKNHLEKLGYQVVVRPKSIKALLEINWEDRSPKCLEEAKND